VTSEGSSEFDAGTEQGGEEAPVVSEATEAAVPESDVSVAYNHDDPRFGSLEGDGTEVEEGEDDATS